jgi:hypothetical protein
MNAFWQATGPPTSRRSARSEARTNGFDVGVAAATPLPHLLEGEDGQELDHAPGASGSANRHSDVRGFRPQVGDAQDGAPH